MRTVFILLVLCTWTVFGQMVKISSVSFQYTPSTVAKKKIYYDISEIKISPNGKVDKAYRIEVTVKNLSDKAVEALVFKYSIRLLLRKGEKIFKDVAFKAEELRISRIAPLSEKKVYIYNTNLPQQLKRIKACGFDPASVELEIAKEPRKGDEAIDISYFQFPFSR